MMTEQLTGKSPPPSERTHTMCYTTAFVALQSNRLYAWQMMGVQRTEGKSCDTQHDHTYWIDAAADQREGMAACSSEEVVTVTIMQGCLSIAQNEAALVHTLHALVLGGAAWVASGLDGSPPREGSDALFWREGGDK